MKTSVKYFGLEVGPYAT